MQEIDFYFDFVSPYTYLASRALPMIAERHDARLIYHPIDLVALMQRVGNRPTSLECANKGAYVMMDIQRLAERYKIPFAGNPAWPTIDFPRLIRGALIAKTIGLDGTYVPAIFSAVWEQSIDLGDCAQLEAVITRAGLDAADLLGRADSAEGVQLLAQAVEDAAQRGVFGSPTTFMAGEMFFGSDRLDILDERLAMNSTNSCSERRRA